MAHPRGMQVCRSGANLPALSVRLRHCDRRRPAGERVPVLLQPRPADGCYRRLPSGAGNLCSAQVLYTASSVLATADQ